MQKIELSQGTIDALKRIDATHEQINQQGQEIFTQLQAQLHQLANEKNMILSVVRAEKGIDPLIKLRLNEDYSLEEITEEEFKDLTEKANT